MTALDNAHAFDVRAYRKRLFGVDDILKRASMAGLSEAQLAELIRDCAETERGATCSERETRLLLRGYANHEIEIDDLMALALMLGRDEHDLDDLTRRCASIDRQNAA